MVNHLVTEMLGAHAVACRVSTIDSGSSTNCPALGRSLFMNGANTSEYTRHVPIKRIHINEIYLWHTTCSGMGKGCMHRLLQTRSGRDNGAGARTTVSCVQS